MWYLVNLLAAVLFIAVLAIVIGLPYCRKVALMAVAEQTRDFRELAMFLAQRAKVNIKESADIWMTFLPAAQRLVDDHIQKRQMMMTARIQL